MALTECYLPHLQQLQPGSEAPYAAAMPHTHHARPLTYLKSVNMNQARRQHHNHTHHTHTHSHSHRQTHAASLPLQVQVSTPPSVSLPQATWAPAPLPPPPPPEKDYSIPLHVDCSVEYELPDCAKPPQGVKIEPLLMIHPAHFRRLDSLRRCPFVNNLPAACGLPAEMPARVPTGAIGSRRMPRPPEIAEEAAACRRPRRWTRPSCCGGEPWPPAPVPGVAGPGAGVAAPREGDTLENSGFGKCVRGYGAGRSARQMSHPYLSVPDSVSVSGLPGSAAVAAVDCDSLFQVQGQTQTQTQTLAQGDRLISPYRAKMFAADQAVYQNYPIVMYK